MKSRSLFMLLAASMFAGAVSVSCDDGNGGGGQDGTSAKLSVAPSAGIVFQASGNDDVILTVTTAFDAWEYEKPDWVNAIQSGNKLVLNAEDNKGVQRSGTIKFTAGDAAPVSVGVTQEPMPGMDPAESLKGSAYYVLAMDPVSFAQIEERVVQDLRVDEQTMFYDVWSDTYRETVTMGRNYYGQMGDGIGWFGVEVAPGQTWSGGGQSMRNSKFVTVGEEFGDDWYFHFAVKSNGAPHGFKVWGAGAAGESSASYKIGIGGQYVDAGKNETYPDYFPDNRMDGEWKRYEVSVADMKKAGWQPWDQDGYLYSFISGGTAGRTLELDAVFFYKK